MTAVQTVPAVTAALIAQGTVTVITAADRGIDGRVLIRADRLSPDQADAKFMSDLHVALGLRQPGVIIHPGCIVASGTVEWVPIWRLHRKGKYVYSPGRGQLRIVDALERQRHITDQLPYGGFAPGRWAGILTDVKATTDRCPACWGEDELGQGCERHPPTCQREPCGYYDGWCCPYCMGRGCPPIPCDDVKEWP